MDRPPIWQMIKEAVEKLDGRATYAEIRRYIASKWQDVNEKSISQQIIVLTVNQPSRIHYPENKKPRFTNSKYDLLYSTGSGKVVKYNREEHGDYEIFQKNEFGGLGIRQVIIQDEDEEINEQEVDSYLFPIEANLRDFLILNLKTIKNHKLKLYVDSNKREGKEYPTDVGPIDILAVDENGHFIVFELKLSRGADRAIGQILRYMGWVQENLAKEKKVSGIIVANKMDNKIKYAVKMTPNIDLFEYEMKFELTKI